MLSYPYHSHLSANSPAAQPVHPQLTRNTGLHIMDPVLPVSLTSQALYGNLQPSAVAAAAATSGRAGHSTTFLPWERAA